MTKIIDEQLEKLKQYVCEVDGKTTSQLTEDFSTVTFRDKSVKSEVKKDTNEVSVVFEDYIIHPYPGFDFHEKFNKGIAPSNRMMSGIVLKETEKMLYMSLQDSNGDVWVGWCPKKSCHITKQY